MIKKGIKLSLQLNQFCFEDKEFNQYALSLEDWNELKVLREFLKIFKDCDKFMQQENYSNSSHIIPTYNILFEALDNVKKDNLEEACKSGYKKLEKYFYLTDLSPANMLAAILSPNQKKQYFRENQWEESAIEELEKSLVILI